MKFYVLTALLIAAVTVAAASLGYLCLRHHGTPHGQADSLAWLRTEFSLNPEQMARIEQSHQAYSVICEQHCTMIRDQREELSRLEASGASPAEIAAAREEAQRIDAHCIESVEAHAREIATIIGGEQSERYLKVILPRLASFDHATAPDLMLNSARTDAPTACH